MIFSAMEGWVLCFYIYLVLVTVSDDSLKGEGSVALMILFSLILSGVFFSD